MCTMRACFAAGKGYCSIYFNTQASVNKPPVISGISGPTTLSINASGTWTVRASDPESDNLSYSVMWGDEQLPNALSAGVSPNHAFVQTTTFTHTYSTAGTYAVTITVQDNSGGSARSSVSVRVSDSDISCTAEYAPMCGQPPEPACRRATPACMLPTPGPRTYSNQCELQKAGATLLYQGSCQDSIVACTADAMMCPNGSYVGRTGPNCQFVCP